MAATDRIAGTFPRVLRTVPAACFLADVDGATIFVNDRWVELTGMAAEDAMGDGWLSAVHLEDRDRVRDCRAEVLKRGVELSVEYRIVRDDAAPLWVNASIGPLFEESEILGCVGWIADISSRIDLERFLERALMEQVKATERLRSEEARFRAAMDGVTDGLWQLDSGWRTTFANARLGELLGVPVRDLTDRSLFDFVNPPAVEELRSVLDGAGGERIVHGTELVQASGRIIPVVLSANQAERAVGRAHGWLVAVTDIGALRAAEAQLHVVDQEFQAVFERAPVGISVIDLDGRFVRVNQALCDMAGYDRNELNGRGADLLLVADERLATSERIAGQLFEDPTSHATIETRLLRKDGRIRWTMSDSSVVTNADGQPAFVVTLSFDITDRKHLEERLVYEASHDQLTGLPNRTLLNELLGQSLARTARRNAPLAVMFIDLDFFKEVNDSLGHRAGDELLCEVASRLRSALRLGDVVARWGGDEFVLLCEDIGGYAGAQQVADRICDAMTAKFSLSAGSAAISASVGFALSDGHDEPEELLHNADEALYRAKAGGRRRAVGHQQVDPTGKPAPT